MKKIKIKVAKKPKATKTKTKKAKPEKQKRNLFKSFLNFVLLGAIGLVSLFLVFALYIVLTSPDFDQSLLYQKEPTILYDINGDELARIGTKDSTLVTFEELPEVIVDALVATEDSRFFQHNGLDLVRFLKASVLQVLGNNDAGGASTLSMQVVKNTYTKKNQTETGSQSFIRKFKDIYISVFKLETNYTKQEIIEFYLNSQWFANTGNINVSDGLWGIERASQWYFGKSSKDLNLSEASLLVGMFQNTRLYNPYRNPEGCRNRQRIVLKLMVNHGYITQEQADAVLAIPIKSMFVQHKDDESAGSSQAFIDYVLNEVKEKYGVSPSEISLKIYTTFNPKIQSILEKVENGEVAKFPNSVVQEGIAVTDTRTGALVAISGGRNYKPKGTNRAEEVKQPGSTAKPIVDYAMYIEHISKSSYSMFLDEKTTYSNGTSISNYDKAYKGLVTMRYALDDSRNIPALLAFQAVAKLDSNILKKFIHSVGIDYGKDLFESASIGGFSKGLSPIQLSAAYAAFARGGYYIEPYSFTKIINNETGDEYNNSYNKVQVMEESTAFMINDILIDSYNGQGVSGTTIAGKTGTTNLDKATIEQRKLPQGALMDVWIASYSPSYSIALWYGYDQIYNDAAEKKYYLTSDAASPMRRKMMNYLATKIHEKNQTFKVPKTVREVSVELETFPAQLCSAYTPADMCVKEYFVRGYEPTDVSTRYSALNNPTNGSYTFNGNTITLNWEPIETPNAINENKLQEHFRKYYGAYATKYYENRLLYNTDNLGTLGYEIYLQNEDATLTYLGYTSSNTFNYNAPAGGKYTFVIKSAYSIFKDNMSSGLSISAQANIQSPVEDMINPDTNEED